MPVQSNNSHLHPLDTHAHCLSLDNHNHPPSRYKDYLEDNLFLLNRELSKPLLQVRRLCLEIQTIPMYKVTPETETLERHCQAQATQRDRTHKELTRYLLPGAPFPLQPTAVGWLGG